MKTSLSILTAGVLLAAHPVPALAQDAVIEDAAAVRITENGLRFVEKKLEKRLLDVQKDRVSMEDILCFDAVGIDGLDVEAMIDTASFDFRTDGESLAVVVTLDYVDIKGSLFGEDADPFPICDDFRVELEQMLLQNVTFTARIHPSVTEAHELFIEIVEPPHIDAEDLFIDTSLFPDFVEEFVFSLEFVQDFVLKTMNGLLEEKAPELLDEPLLVAVFRGDLGAIHWTVALDELSIDDGGANAVLDASLQGPATPNACVEPDPAAGQAIPVRGTHGLGEYGDTSMFEASVSDSLAQQGIDAIWMAGLLCYDSDTRPLAGLEGVLTGLSPEMGEMVSYEMRMARRPLVRFDDAGIGVKLPGFELSMWAETPETEKKLLLSMRADLNMRARMEVDVATNQILLSMDAFAMSLTNVESEVLFTDDEQAEADFQQFFQAWVAPRIAAKVQRMPVTSAVLPLADPIVVVDALHHREGHLVGGATLYDANDPAIDRLAPDTFVDADDVKGTVATIAFTGSDDRAGELTFSWRVDQGPWSPFAPVSEAHLLALSKGDHVFEVKARDRWQNEDGTPASTTFYAAGHRAHPEMGSPMGCSVASVVPVRAPRGAWLALIPLVLPLLRRRGR